MKFLLILLVKPLVFLFKSWIAWYSAQKGAEQLSDYLAGQPAGRPRRRRKRWGKIGWGTVVPVVLFVAVTYHYFVATDPCSHRFLNHVMLLLSPNDWMLTCLDADAVARYLAPDSSKEELLNEIERTGRRRGHNR